MIPGEFEYHSPSTLVEAVVLLEKHGYDAKILAGGQSLIPAMRFRLALPEVLIDINGIEGLAYLKESNGHLAIGSMTREADLEESALVQNSYRMLADAARVIADPIVRNRATVGGNLAHSDPANGDQRGVKSPDLRRSPPGAPVYRRNGPEREGLTDLSMTCYSGGAMEIYIEPQQPRPRLLITGALPVAQALAHLGAAMNYHVVAVDLDNSGKSIPHAHEVLTSLDDVAAQIRPNTYVVVATHGNYDELALEKILAANPTYVGLVASPTRARAVRDYLVAQGLSETDLLPLKSPAGLNIQARRGDEIALSIMAEIVQISRNFEILNLELFRKRTDIASIPLEIADQHVESIQKGETAIDPICRMSVDIATAKYTSAFEETIFYFCCAGCKSEFEENPSAHIGETVEHDDLSAHHTKS